MGPRESLNFEAATMQNKQPLVKWNSSFGESKVLLAAWKRLNLRKWSSKIARHASVLSRPSVFPDVQSRDPKLIGADVGPVNPTLMRQIFQPPQSIGKKACNPGNPRTRKLISNHFWCGMGISTVQRTPDFWFFRIPGLKLQSTPKANTLHTEPGHPWPASKRQTFACPPRAGALGPRVDVTPWESQSAGYEFIFYLEIATFRFASCGQPS